MNRTGEDEAAAGGAGIDVFDRTRTDLDRSPLDAPELLSQPIWKELRTFLAVAKSRSYAQAALLLNASPPTVSREVRRLEEQIGAQLVVSSFAGVRLTPAGRALAMDLSELDFRLASMSRNIKKEQDGLAGRVSLSVTSGLSVAFVAPAVRRLNEAFPRIEIDLKEQISFLSFEKNQTEVMIGLAEITRADICCREIGTLHLIPVASRAYVEANGLPGRHTTRQHAFLQCGYYASENGAWSGWSALLAAGRLTHTCENSLAYYALVKSGAGIGLLGNYTLIEPDLMPLDLGVHIPIKLYAYATADRLRSRPVAAVFDWIVEVFRENPFFAPKLTLAPGATQAENDFRRFFNIAPAGEAPARR